MPDRTPQQWDKYWNMRRRRNQRYWEKHGCQHDWQKQPKDFFQWHCPNCGAWSRRTRPFNVSEKGSVERPNEDNIMPSLNK